MPRLRDLDLDTGIVGEVREEIGPDVPLNVLGVGHLDAVRIVLAVGVDSVDASSYVRVAADGRLWSDPAVQLDDPALRDRLHLALCNLAAATGATLPLSASTTAFRTLTLDYWRNCGAEPAGTTSVYFTTG